MHVYDTTVMVEQRSEFRKLAHCMGHIMQMKETVLSVSLVPSFCEDVPAKSSRWI